MKKVLIFCLVVSSTVWAMSAQAAYLITRWSDLYQYDINQGATYIGRTSWGMKDIAMASNRLYGVAFSAFYSIDVNTGHSSLIRRDFGFAMINALVGSPTGDTLYALSKGGRFARLSDTGQYSLIGSLGSYEGRALFSRGDMAFGADGTLYATVNNGRGDYLATIDVDTGQATVLGDIGYSAVYGLVFLDGTLYGTTADHDLIEIDQTTGQGTHVTGIVGIESGPITGAAGDPSDTIASGATPEPATLLLLSSAMGMILWRRRRRAVG